MSKFKKGDRVEHKQDRELIGTVSRNLPVSDEVLVNWDSGWADKYSDDEIDNHIPTHPLDSYTIPEIIAHFGWENIIDEIGEDKAKEYFHLRERH